jgi:CRISPR-associated protein Cas2
MQDGFIMLQESVYSKLVLNGSAAKSTSSFIKRVKPPHGLVQLLTVTENQFARMEFISGEFRSAFLDTDERLVIL